MLEDILKLEREAFLFCNGSDYLFLGRFMWLYSGKMVWYPLAAFILFLLIYKKNWKEILLIVLGIVLVITLCDQSASHVCKPMFTRFRPTHHPDFMEHVKVVFGYRGGRHGFISSHAANAFGFATFISLLMRQKFLTITLFVWAFLMSYTRIYLGVHFISDIVPGAISGTIFGYMVYKIYVASRSAWYRKIGVQAGSTIELYSLQTKQMIAYAIPLTILIILLFNAPLVQILR